MQLKKLFLAATLTLLAALNANVGLGQDMGPARRITYGDTLPSVCRAAGEVFIRTGATNPGLYRCTATNTWTQMQPVSGGNVDLDMNNNLILNIGATGTDFTAGGGLNIANSLGVGGPGDGTAGHLTVGASGSVAGVLYIHATTAGGAYGSFNAPAANPGRVVFTGGGGVGATENTLAIAANLLPVTTNSYDNGNTAARWKGLYLADDGLSIVGTGEFPVKMQRSAVSDVWYIGMDANALYIRDNTSGVNVASFLENGGVTLAGLTQATLGTPANGTIVYCSDCTIGAGCAGGGTGALAKRLNGAWVCN